MDRQQWPTEQFEQHRAHLQSVAQRMLGSAAEAEDAVQEAWLRVSRAEADEVDNMRGWLTTIVSRICLDMLRARRVRREELVDGWFPESVIEFDQPADPEREALMADSVGMALMVVLERLTPAERLAFVLHDMFGVSFEEIAPIVERNVAATRQLASRARRRVRGVAEPGPREVAAQRQVVESFLAASREGKFEALLAVLDPDVVFRVDAGELPVPVPTVVRGSEEVAKIVIARGTPVAHLGRPAWVKGRPGAIVVVEDQVRSIVSFTIVDGRVTEMDLVLDPVKLQAVRG